MTQVVQLGVSTVEKKESRPTVAATAAYLADWKESTEMVDSKGSRLEVVAVVLTVATWDQQSVEWKEFSLGERNSVVVKEFLMAKQLVDVREIKSESKMGIWMAACLGHLQVEMMGCDLVS